MTAADRDDLRAALEQYAEYVIREGAHTTIDPDGTVWANIPLHGPRSILAEHPAPEPPGDEAEDEVAEVITRGAERVAQTVERARKVLDGWEHDGPDGYEFHLLIRRVREALELPLDHDFLPVQGHPDDDECTHREDGTDATYCGRTEAEHREEHPAPHDPHYWPTGAVGCVCPGFGTGKA